MSYVLIKRMVVHDAVIVLGSHLGDLFKARMDAGVRVFNMGLANKMILVGGTNRYGIPEYEMMRFWAKAEGVPSNVILTEGKSIDIFTNAKYAKEIMDKANLNSAIVVTSPFCMRRVKKVFTGLMPEKELTFLDSEDKYHNVIQRVKNFFIERHATRRDVKRLKA